MIFKSIIYIFLVLLALIGIKQRLHISQLKCYDLVKISQYLLCGDRLKSSKTPLVYTHRIWRILAINIVLYLVMFAIIFAPFGMLEYVLCGVVLAMSSWSILISILILAPVERLIMNAYISRATAKLARVRCKVIGITGSVGKTSVKNILHTILSDRYDVVSTPKNYNTTSGITRTILERVSSDTEVLILEMGARHIGDIAQICHIARPHIGVITAISGAHMESFGSIDNICKAKYEIAEYASIMVFNTDDLRVAEMYQSYEGDKRSVSIDTPSDTRAIHIVYDDGMTFDITHADTTLPVHTDLLGRHNVANILLASSVALSLGMTLDEIALRIPYIQPIEHRLQIMHGYNGITIIDDTYNASPASVTAALDVLSHFSGKKVVATCGIVEGGDMQSIYNTFFAQQISRVADMAIIISHTNRTALVGGLTLDSANIFVVDTLSDAQVVFGKILKKGDTLLLVNDLPDDYK